MTELDSLPLRTFVGTLWPRFKMTPEIATIWCDELKRFDYADVRMELNRQRRRDMLARDPNFRDLKRALYEARAKHAPEAQQRTPSYALFSRTRNTWPIAAELCVAFDTGKINGDRLVTWDVAVQTLVQTLSVVQGRCEHGRVCLACYGWKAAKPEDADRNQKLADRVVAMFTRLEPCGYATQTWRQDVLNAMARKPVATEVPF